MALLSHLELVNLEEVLKQVVAAVVERHDQVLSQLQVAVLQVPKEPQVAVAVALAALSQLELVTLEVVPKQPVAVVELHEDLSDLHVVPAVSLPLV